MDYYTVHMYVLCIYSIRTTILCIDSTTVLSDVLSYVFKVICYLDYKL